MFARSIDVDGHTRSYHLSVPADAAGPLPVVVALHGKGDTGGDFLEATGLSALRALVAAPTGVGLAWSPAPYAHTTLAQDTALIHAIVDQLEAEYNVDPARIYLVGFSNGGGLAALLAARAARFAGAATVSAAVRITPDEIGRGAHPVDYLNIHGTYDDVVPYAGEQRSPYSGAADDTTYGAEAVTAAVATRAGGQGRALHHRAEGMGHEWPRGTRLDAVEEIANFFGLQRAE
ncbi:PHB depolymerase family esterase [Corynebacterium sp. Marseille-P4321]|uniref:alpha/beta hydrolase family esterase n=1 Tax=Corynebacterium sp. Marseille-P4321 TaxID=2736603 RepID=UPI00158970DE|nr:PHB depolymerase family esterase [Corynebacterium sp. Marseille-P4321]